MKPQRNKRLVIIGVITACVFAFVALLKYRAVHDIGVTAGQGGGSSAPSWDKEPDKPVIVSIAEVIFAVPLAIWKQFKK